MTQIQSQRLRARDLSISPGIFAPGAFNAITDVSGVTVGQVTLKEGDSVRTGLTVILPHQGNLYQEKAPAAVHVANGYGKIAGALQIKELGEIETPIALTNTLSVPAAMEGLVRHTLSQPGNESVRSVNAIAGETNDGYLNDIRGMHVRPEHVLQAIAAARSGAVAEGSVGAGTGVRLFGFKGGVGTSSRRIPDSRGGFTVGVLVQSNYGGILMVDGVPVGEELGQYSYKSDVEDPSPDGSCMVIVATDAPLDARNLGRLASRAVIGIGRTGSFISNGSGDFVIAFSTAYTIPNDGELTNPPVELLRNGAMSPLFLAAAEATEEALLNSLFMATTVEGRDGNRVEAIDLEKVKEILAKYRPQ